MKRLDKKVALITGAASGVGAAIARRFAEEGASIFAFDVNEPACQDWGVAAKTADYFQFLQGDIRIESSVKSVIDQIIEIKGSLDIVVNAVGVSGVHVAETLDVAEWDRILNINLRGTFVTCFHALPVMAAQNSIGSVINISSFGSAESQAVTSALNAAKDGLFSLTKDLAVDYGRKGVRVNAICPGYIETPALTEILDKPGLERVRANIEEAQRMGRMGTPLEIANAALFLASEEASFITGHILYVDGGMSACKRLGVFGIE